MKQAPSDTVCHRVIKFCLHLSRPTSRATGQRQRAYQTAEFSLCQTWEWNCQTSLGRANHLNQIQMVTCLPLLIERPTYTVCYHLWYWHDIDLDVLRVWGGNAVMSLTMLWEAYLAPSSPAGRKSPGSSTGKECSRCTEAVSSQQGLSPICGPLLHVFPPLSHPIFWHSSVVQSKKIMNDSYVPCQHLYSKFQHMNGLQKHTLPTFILATGFAPSWIWPLLFTLTPLQHSGSPCIAYMCLWKEGF